MDRETREFLDRKFNAIDDKLVGFDQKFTGIDEKFEETKRYFGVIAEGLQTEIRQVAEGVANVDEKLDREMTSLREENEQAHREILSAIKFSYAELDRRITTIEGEVSSLKSRMERLEARQ
jgi:chromosome segregation ATPase